MTDGSGDSDAWAFTEGADWLEGRHRRDNSYVHEHAGRTDRETTREVLTSIRQAFQRAMSNGWIDVDENADIRTVEDLEAFRNLEEFARTERFAEAVEDGDAEAIRSMVGSQTQAPDVSGYRTINWLESWITEPAKVVYMFGTMGSGKTSFGCFLGEIWEDQIGGLVGTNIRSLDAADDWIPSYPQLEAWLRQDEEAWLDPDREDGQRKLFIFDEASSHATGRGKEGYEAAKKLGPLTRKIRKYGGSMIIIGHDGKDVHPAVRAVGDAVHKEDLTEATVYESVDNRQGQEEIQSLQGIPDTNWDPNDKEPTSWSWGSEDQEEQLEEQAMALADEIADDRVEDELLEVAVEARRSGQSYGDIDEWHPWSYGKMHERVSEVVG